MKPAIDRTTAVVTLLLIAVPMIVLAMAVMISLGRPIFFRQERVGRGGASFNVFKFRTMAHDRREQHVPVPFDRRTTHKSDSDPRLTAVGRFLRKWSLDELPQLINVALGQMSLVGPRPELPEIVAGYSSELHRRHLVKPGLTGLWQVSARGEGLMHENPEWDLRYVDEISWRTDVGIVLRTPFAMLGAHRGI